MYISEISKAFEVMQSDIFKYIDFVFTNEGKNV